jgi:hypothetical protein
LRPEKLHATMRKKMIDLSDANTFGHRERSVETELDIPCVVSREET